LGDYKYTTTVDAGRRKVIIELGPDHTYNAVEEPLLLRKEFLYKSGCANIPKPYLKDVTVPPLKPARINIVQDGTGDVKQCQQVTITTLTHNLPLRKPQNLIYTCTSAETNTGAVTNTVLLNEIQTILNGKSGQLSF
jgi:hypothetical protein